MLCWQVWRSLCKPFNSFVAVKMLDLESMNANLVGGTCIHAVLNWSFILLVVKLGHKFECRKVRAG